MQAEKGVKSVPSSSEEQQAVPEVSFGTEDIGQTTAKVIQKLPVEEEHGAQQAELPAWRLMIIIAG